MAFQSSFLLAPIFLPLSLPPFIVYSMSSVRPTDSSSSELCLLASISKDDVNISDSDFAAGDSTDTDNSHSAGRAGRMSLPSLGLVRSAQISDC